MWIAANAAAFSFQWDPYPFILLDLAFSTQAADAARLILLAATRQAERDKIRDGALEKHHEAEVQRQRDFEAPRPRSWNASERWPSSTCSCSRRTHN